jgi:phosphate:Na+ symporter
VLRDLKRIHSHICSVAYPVLDGQPEAYRRPEAIPAAAPISSPLPRQT